MRKVHSHARLGNRSGWGKNNRSGNRRNGRDDEQDDRQQQPNKGQTYVSLISDDEEDGEDIVSPSNKRNVSHVDNPNNSPARKKVASGSVSGSNSSPFSAAGPAFPATTDLALRMSPSPQGRNIVGQLTAQLHQKQDENSQLMEKIDDMRLAAAEKDTEIASLREIIEGMQQAPTNSSAHNIAQSVQQNASEQPVQQAASGNQASLAVANQPCGTCADTSALKQKLADAQLSLSKTRNTVADQHDQIKALTEQVSSNKTTLLEERAAVAQHKLSIDQLNLKLAAEEASAKNLHSTLAENRTIIDQLNAQLAAQTQDLSESRATITTNESTIKDLKDKLEYKEMQPEGGLDAYEEKEKTIEELNVIIEDLKKQLAGSQAALQESHTTNSVNETVIHELKEQMSGSQRSAPESTTKDKDQEKEGAKTASKFVKELKLKLEEAEQVIEKLTAHAEKAEKEMAELTKDGFKDLDEMESLRKELVTAWKTGDEMEGKLKKKEKELADLNSQFEQQQEELAEYKDRVEQQQQKLAEYETKLKQQQHAFGQEKEKLNALIKSLRDELERKEAERAPQMDALSEEVASLKEQLFYMESERDQFAKEVEMHTEKANQQREQDEAMRAAFQISQTHVISLRNQLDARNVQTADLEEKVKTLQAQLDAANNRAKAAKEQNAQMVESYKLQQNQLYPQHSGNLQQQNAIISQLQERNRSLEALNQSHNIHNMEARIMELQAQLYAAQNSIDPRVISQDIEISELQSELQLKNDELRSINEQLDRVFNQYQDLSDERAKNRKKIAELEQRNYDLAAHFQRVMGERDQALQELAGTKAALQQTRKDLEFTIRQADAIDEGGDPEFAYMESAWEPKLRDAQAQHEAAAKDRDGALQQVTDLTAQLEVMCTERDDLNQQLEASRAELTEIQTVVEDLTSQLPKADNSELDPAVKATLEKARGIQTASDITTNRAQRVPPSSVRTISDEDVDQFLMPARTSPLPDSAVKAAKNEELQKMIRDLEKSHEETEETVRKLITRLKGKTIKTQALEKELKVHKALLQTKDRFIDQATARLSGNLQGVANPEQETMMDLDVDLNESAGEDEPEQEDEPDQEEDVDMEDAEPSQKKTRMITFGPTRRGYKVWKEDEPLKDFDRFEGSTSYALRVAFMTDKGKKIYLALRQYSNLPGDQVPSSAAATSTTTATMSAATQTTATPSAATQFADVSLVPQAAPSLYPTTQATPTTVRPSPLPPLRSASTSTTPQAFLSPAVQSRTTNSAPSSSIWSLSPNNNPPSTTSQERSQPAQLTTPYRAPSPKWALSSHTNNNRNRTQEPSPSVQSTAPYRAPSPKWTLSSHSNPPSSNQEASTSAVYPAPTFRGRSTRGRYSVTSSRFRTPTTMAGPGQPRGYPAPQSWGGHEDVDMDVLASQFTMESIEEPMAEEGEEEEMEEEELRGRGRGRRGSEGEY